MTKQEALNTINTSFPTIWSKDDVLSLINSIEETTGIDEKKLLERIKTHLENAIHNVDFDEYVSDVEFEITLYNEIGISHYNFNTTTLIRELTDNIEKVFKKD
jgi:hypothetical protein